MTTNQNSNAWMIATSPLDAIRVLLLIVTSALRIILRTLRDILKHLPVGVTELITVALTFCTGYTSMCITYGWEEPYVLLELDGIIVPWLILQIASAEQSIEALETAADKRHSMRWIAATELLYLLLLCLVTLGFVVSILINGATLTVVVIALFCIGSLTRRCVRRYVTIVNSQVRQLFNT